MTNQQAGMLRDIQTTGTLAALHALAAMEGEYPEVFIPAIRQAFVSRELAIINAPSKRYHTSNVAERVCVTGTQHPKGFYAKMCRFCESVRNKLRRVAHTAHL